MATMIKDIGIVIFDGIERLDIEGPLGVLGWTMMAGGHQLNIRFLSKDGGQVRDHLVHRSITADDVIEHVTALDLLIVPGGNLREFQGDTKLVQQIKDLAQKSQIVASVCTGAFLIAKTGLANGKKMTTHWNFRRQFQQEFSAITLVEQRFVNDGTLWSSAGISAGIDMSLRLVQAYWGDDIAKRVQAGLEYFPEPPFTRREVAGS